MIKSERSINDEIALEYNLQSSFNLTSIINSQQPTPRSLSRTLIDFITQKINPSEDSLRSIKQDSQSPQQFTTYLNEIGGWLEQVKSRVSKKYNKDLVNYTGEQGITKCYSDIPYVFFDKQFALKMDNYGISDKMKDQQQELIQYLDLIEINLYYQVNSKFSDFYEALSNFEDLEHRVEDNINRLLIVRREIPVIKRQFTEKAQKILKILQLKTNKQAVLRHLTIMRSLKKLPPTIKTILQSPLPHESLELLSTGKSMYSIVKRIQSMKSVGDSLDKSDSIIKHSLQKSFSDKFFLYLMSPLNAQYGKNFEQLSLCSAQNNVDNSYILQFAQPHIFKQPQTPDRIIKTEQQLVITIIQSCCFVDFVTGSRIKTKIIDHSKLVSKQFFQSLKSHIINYFEKNSKQQRLLNQNLNEVLDKINIQNFDKILEMYHKNYKITIKRLLFILQTLYQKLQNQTQNENRQKFIDIVQQLFYLLSGLLKIVSDQTTTLYDIKKLFKQINIEQFKLYLVPLTRWIQYIQQILSSDLFKEKQQCMTGLEVQEYKNKIQILLQPLIEKKSKLEDAYITNFHMRIISNEIKSNLQKQTWAAVEDISYQYLTFFNYIFNKNYQSVQKSINNSFNNSFVEELKVMQIKQNIANNQTNHVSPQDIVDIKIFKNGIILNRKIYKTTVSFLEFCQTFYKYLKIQELFPTKHKEMVMRIGDISTYYSSYSTQLIVYAGALKFNLIKNKLITVKHLCLLWCNIRILVCMLKAQKHPELEKVIIQVQNQSKEVIKKMSNIICTKVQNELSSLIREGLGAPVPTKHTTNIINSQRQMIQITQQYLDEASIKQILAQSINLMIKKFLQFVESKGQRGHLQGKYYFESMNVLEILFEDQMQYMKKILKL